MKFEICIDSVEAAIQLRKPGHTGLNCATIWLKVEQHPVRERRG